MIRNTRNYISKSMLIIQGKFIIMNYFENYVKQFQSHKTNIEQKTENNEHKSSAEEDPGWFEWIFGKISFSMD